MGNLGIILIVLLLTLPHLVARHISIGGILLQSRIDPDLVVEHRLVLSVLDAHFLRMSGTLAYVDRSVSHVHLIGRLPVAFAVLLLQKVCLIIDAHTLL